VDSSRWIFIGASADSELPPQGYSSRLTPRQRTGGVQGFQEYTNPTCARKTGRMIRFLLSARNNVRTLRRAPADILAHIPQELNTIVAKGAPGTPCQLRKSKYSKDADGLENTAASTGACSPLHSIFRRVSNSSIGWLAARLR
jgi:hypothetical protein